MPLTNDPAEVRAAAAKSADAKISEAARCAVENQTMDNEPDYEDGLMPLDFMLRTMRNKKEDLKDRKEAAKLALPYSHSRLSPIAPVENQETEKQKRYKEVSNSLARKLAEFRAKLGGGL